MKELKHDSESYIITIRRKGQQATASQTVTTSVAPRMKPLFHEHESSDLHDSQAPHTATSGNANDQAPYGAITEVTAPLPGIIVALKVNVGDIVNEGQELAVLEAMKMENSIESPRSGTVRSINTTLGGTVSEGTVIMAIE